MATLLAEPGTEVAALTLHLEPVVHLTDEQIFELCRRNRDLRIERTADGELLVMPPVGGETSDRNAEIVMQLRRWAKAEGRGRAFDSSAGFVLPNGAIRGPDASWVESERLHALTPGQRQRFLPLCPTFVVELRSASDSLPALEAKMQEYRENGTRLGWLIDPAEARIRVYRPGREVEVLEKPPSVSADPELPGFVLDLGEIWHPAW